ncbi:MAG: hypothetical protein ACQEQS_03035 [Thermodesulfobacteriota bacterium]
MSSIFKNPRLIFLLTVCILFFGFGIYSIIQAYRINNPFIFLIFFFSASFMILFSAAVFVSIFFMGKEKDIE